MKKTLTFLSIFLFILNINLFGQSDEFSFRGKVFAYGDALKGASVKVYNLGDLIYETSSKAGGKFNFKLEAEKEYTVDISKENLRTKTIWINTEQTSDVKENIPAFSFDIVLKKEKMTRFDELSEIPVTLIKYMAKQKSFHMDKTYEQAVNNKKEQIKANTIDIRNFK